MMSGTAGNGSGVLAGQPKTQSNSQANTKILIIEDDQNISELIRYNLEATGYSVLTAYDGETGFRMVGEERPDLVVLDLMLPKMDGIEICNRIRRTDELSNTAVIMVTARGSETDRIVGLEIGADDYMTKPFSVRELEARIRTVLRRAKSQPDEAASTGITLDKRSVYAKKTVCHFFIYHNFDSAVYGADVQQPDPSKLHERRRRAPELRCQIHFAPPRNGRGRDW